MSDSPAAAGTRPGRAAPRPRHPSEDFFKGIDDFKRKATEQFAGRQAGVCVGDCNGNMANLDCEGLRKEKEAVEKAQERAAMAEATYEKDPSKRRPPPGWSNASDEDLRSLGLINSNGEKLTTITDSDFGSAVFKNNSTGEYVIGFEGTKPLSRQDWLTNGGQGLGRESEYYTQAIQIARRANANAPGRVSFTGHSLGGGMASAAAASTGRPATTFNAAGLHANTVPGYGGNAPIDAWYVKGDILSSIQDNTPLTPNAAGRRLPMTPRSWLDNPTGMPTGALRGVELHGMPQVQDALSEKKKHIENLRKLKNCPT